MKKTSQKLQVIIVDDELPGRKNLKKLFEEYCSEEIDVVALASSADEAKRKIEDKKPDVVFLDIEMPYANGFQLLESIPQREFLVVFVTAYDNYGIEAIKASAVDYILKPVDIQDLRNAVQKLQEVHTLKKTNSILQKNYSFSLEHLLKTIHKKKYPTKITLPHLQGYTIIDTNTILRLEGDANYTTMYLSDEKPFIVSKSLGEFEEILDTNVFMRIHKTHIINLLHVKKYFSNDGGIICMADGAKIPVSRRQHSNFFKKLKVFAPLLQS